MKARAPVLRRPTGVLLLFLATAPFAAAFASPVAGTCAMCAARCCCRPAGESGGGCRLSAPCAGREPAGSPASPAMRVIVPEPFRLSRPEAPCCAPISSASARFLRMTAVPPDPPPRLPAA